MIKAIRPVSNLDPSAVERRALRGGKGVNQSYRSTPTWGTDTTKTQAAQDAAKDNMSDADYSEALKRASESF